VSFPLCKFTFYADLPIGHIKHCISSDCLSVCLPVRTVPSIYPKLDSRRNLRFRVNMTQNASNWGANLWSKGQKSRSLGTKL